MALRIIRTEDGSTSLYDDNLKESYHSKFGAINESMHVFIDAGLNRISKLDTINILEIGLGTGLNALLTCLFCEEQSIQINYCAIEPYPIEKKIYNQLNFGKCLKNKNTRKYFNIIHEATWGQENNIHGNFKITKFKEKLSEFETPINYYNLIYFDAFSPDIQPELWTLNNFIKIYESLKQDGILVTYCAKGQVRRDLETAGFLTERLPGPAGKREILRATKY